MTKTACFSSKYPGELIKKLQKTSKWKHNLVQYWGIYCGTSRKPSQGHSYNSFYQYIHIYIHI